MHDTPGYFRRDPKLLMTIHLLSPHIPLLFMGEDWGLPPCHRWPWPVTARPRYAA